MISAKEIGALIKDPSSISLSDVEGIEKMKEKYAYASTLHLLVLKAKAMQHSVDFEAALNKSAVYVMDRAYLYDFLHQEEQADVEGVVEKEVENEDTLTLQDNIVEKLDEVVEEIKHPEEEETVLNVIDEKVEGGEEEAAFYDAPADDISLTSLKLDNEVVEGQFEEKIEEEAIEEVVEISEEEISEEEDNGVVIDWEIQEIVNEDEEMSFVEWLKSRKTNKPSEDKEEKKQINQKEQLTTKENVDEFVAEQTEIKEEKKEPEQKIESLPRVEEIKEVVQEKKDKGLSKKQINALLDKFIQSDPKISRPEKDMYNPVKTAQQSVEDQESLVTETLAKIHLLQKNYSKAIETYKRLILVYPEKKIYFATQIEKIREEMTDS